MKTRTPLPLPRQRRPEPPAPRTLLDDLEQLERLSAREPRHLTLPTLLATAGMSLPAWAGLLGLALWALERAGWTL